MGWVAYGESSHLYFVCCVPSELSIGTHQIRRSDISSTPRTGPFVSFLLIMKIRARCIKACSPIFQTYVWDFLTPAIY